MLNNKISGLAFLIHLLSEGFWLAVGVQEVDSKLPSPYLRISLVEQIGRRQSWGLYTWCCSVGRPQLSQNRSQITFLAKLSLPYIWFWISITYLAAMCITSALETTFLSLFVTMACTKTGEESISSKTEWKGFVSTFPQHLSQTHPCSFMLLAAMYEHHGR